MIGAPWASSAPTKWTVWPCILWNRTQMSAWMYSMMWPMCSAPLAYGSAVVTNNFRGLIGDGRRRGVLGLKYAYWLAILRVNHVLDLSQVNQVLSSVIDPNTGHDFVSSRCARNIRVDGQRVSLDVELGYPAASQLELIRELIRAALKRAGAVEVEVAVSMKIVPHS